MKPQELRIGNYVVHRDNKDHILEIKAIDDGEFKVVECVGTHPIDIGNIAPIPLTEECLLKLGFERNVFHQGYEKGDFTIFFLDKIIIFKIGTGSEIIIQYVHELQNLYYALTNNELKVTEL